MMLEFHFRPISKSEFIEKKNDILDKEPFVECQDCGRKLHQIRTEFDRFGGWSSLVKLYTQKAM